MSNIDSAISAGYSPLSAHNVASRLMRNEKIKKQLDAVGLTDKGIAQGIKTNVEAGMGVKATASDSLKGLALASQLKGHLQADKAQPKTLNQTNVYINELKQQDDSAILETLDALQQDIDKLKT